MSKEDVVYNNTDDVSDLMTPIKVLLVQHQNGWVAYVSELLHSSFFEVTHVDESFEAIRLLSKNKSEYELLLISHDMSNVEDIHTFLKQTKDMDVLSIVMSDQEDDAFALDVFKSGAFLVLKTPITKDALRRLRQDVIRERMHKQGMRENKNMTQKAAMTPNIVLEDKGSFSNFENNLVSESSSNNCNDSLKKRIWLKWTPELCEKFDNALIQLGEGRCYPTEIHKLMNVPGLTKRQVASHLQKFRSKIRKSKQRQTASTSLKNPSFSGQEVNERKYGYISFIETFEEGANDVVGVNQTNIGSSSTHESSQKNISQATEYTPPFRYGKGIGSSQIEGFNSEITAKTDFPKGTSGVHDARQGLDHQPFSSDQRQAYDDFLIYSDGNGLNQGLISESFSFSHDHVMQNEDATGTGPRSTSKS